MWKKIKLKIRKYFKGLLIGIDQLVNAILGGYPDETFSSRVYRKSIANQKFWQILHWLIDRIFFWDIDHCYYAYMNEIKGKYSPQSINEIREYEAKREIERKEEESE